VDDHLVRPFRDSELISNVPLPFKLVCVAPYLECGCRSSLMSRSDRGRPVAIGAVCAYSVTVVYTGATVFSYFRT
jgi:hypothetical protein